MVTRNTTLKLMHYECTRLGIRFLIHYGVRNFSYDGKISGATTNEDWNKFINQENLTNTIVKDHYLMYLKALKEKQARYQIRRREDANTEFLNYLVEAGMSNSLTIYSKNKEGVRTYFFVAAPNDKEANCFFYNNLGLFERVIAFVEKHTDKSLHWGEITSLYNHKIFSSYDTKLIFNQTSFSKNHVEGIYLDGQVFKLTKNELKILEYISGNFTLKKLSDLTGLSISGVNFHLSNIKKKIGNEFHQDLVKFANKIQNLI